MSTLSKIFPTASFFLFFLSCDNTNSKKTVETKVFPMHLGINSLNALDLNEKPLPKDDINNIRSLIFEKDIFEVKDIILNISLDSNNLPYYLDDNNKFTYLKVFGADLPNLAGSANLYIVKTIPLPEVHTSKISQTKKLFIILNRKTRIVSIASNEGLYYSKERIFSLIPEKGEENKRILKVTLFHQD